MNSLTKAVDMLGTVYKGYVYQQLFKDVSKFARRNLRNMKFDQNYWLHKVGLGRYTPAKSAIGAASLFVLGAAAGGVLGLMFAPKDGQAMREDVKDRARDILNRSSDVIQSKVRNESPLHA